MIDGTLTLVETLRTEENLIEVEDNPHLAVIDPDHLTTETQIQGCGRLIHTYLALPIDTKEIHLGLGNIKPEDHAVVPRRVSRETESLHRYETTDDGDHRHLEANLDHAAEIGEKVQTLISKGNEGKVTLRLSHAQDRDPVLDLQNTTTENIVNLSNGEIGANQ